MFAKLLKHEFKSNAGILGILTATLLGLGVVATLVLRILVNHGEEMMDSTNPIINLSFMAMTSLLMMSYLALFIYALAVQIILLYRFYKNKYTDEGYLTFTLPVSTQQIFWSSFVNMLIWLAISAAAILLVAILVILFGTATEGLINTDIFTALEKLRQLFGGLEWQMILQEMELAFGGSLAPSAVMLVLLVILAPFYGLMVPIACITIGAVLAKKHKLLAAFGIYYGVNALTSILSTMLTTLPAIFLSTAQLDSVAAYMNTIMAISLLLTLSLTVGAYLLNMHLMKNRLNLA